MRTYLTLILSFLPLFSSEVFSDTEKKYNRDNWYHWNKNVSGCKNLRHALLKITSLEPVTYYSEKQCKVFSGKWYGPYTNTFFYYSSQLDIDHVVPLSWAASHGAINWSRKMKRQFANDIDNLIPVSRYENRKKGSLGLDDYLPPNKDFHCDYINKFENIVLRYKLIYEEDESASLKKIRNSCN